MDPKIAWKGNRKMSWPTWSLPAIATCPSSTPECRRTCYARKAERQYPNVIKARGYNLKLSKRADFIEMMVAELRKRKPTVFRIHESGDFYSMNYFHKWNKIARLCPDTQFYAFTKVKKALNPLRPDNFNLIWSHYYDDKRTPFPVNVPVFIVLPRKEEAKNPDWIRCEGNCDTCGICPNLPSTAIVWTNVH